MSNWLGSWQNRIAITIDNTKIDATLTHFPILLRISGSCGQNSQDLTEVFDEVGANSLKIAVTSDDAITELYVEIEKWDEVGEEAILWISKSDWSISDIANTVIYLYYDNDHANNTTYVGVTNSTPAESVWDANFKGIYHLADGVDNAHIYDSTDNDFDGTKDAANQPIEVVGSIGKAQDFNGTSDWIDRVGNQVLYNDSTIEAIIKADSLAATHLILDENYIAFGYNITYGNDIELKVHDGLAWRHAEAPNATISTGIFYYVVGTYSSITGILEVFINAISKDTGIGYDGTLGSNLEKIGIGAHRLGTGSYWNGIIDELRISNTARSATWIATTYDSLWDDLLTFGDAEIISGVHIDEAVVQIKKHSLSVSNRIEERSIARFDIVDTLGTDSYQRGQPVTVYDVESTLIFGGFISNSTIYRISPEVGLYHRISCMDYHYCADKRVVAESYEDKTCGYIVDDIYDNYLAEEGVTIGTIELGATLVEAVFNYPRVSDAFDSLAEKTGKIWYIDENKALYFVDRDTTAASWNVTGNDTVDRILKGSTSLSGANPQYRNRQYIRGGRDTTDVQVETFTGDGVTVAFTVGYPIVKVPTVTLDGTGQTVGIKGLDTAKQCYWNKGDATVTFETAPPNTEPVVVTYYGQFDVLIVVENSVEIAAQAAIEGSGTGYVDDMDDEPSLNDKDAAMDSGEAKVERFGVNSQRLTYQTTRTGLKPGQIQTVTNSKYGLSAVQMLIESVDIRGFGSTMISTVRVIVGPESGSWAKYFATLSGMKDKIMDRLNVGSNQLLIILVDRAEIWEQEESITETVFACPVVALDLYPGLTVYPC